VTVPTPAPRRLEITLAGLRFHVRVGVLPHERELAQPLEIDLTVRLARESEVVLDYRTLYAIARAVVGAEPLDYLESVGESIAAAALALEGVAWVRVAVRKPHVALGGPLAYAEVVVEQGT
jgi:7,8-dihydroneopterin aldolase/epimerase/oxygenase